MCQTWNQLWSSPLTWWSGSLRVRLRSPPWWFANTRTKSWAWNRSNTNNRGSSKEDRKAIASQWSKSWFRAPPHGQLSLRRNNRLFFGFIRLFSSDFNCLTRYPVVRLTWKKHSHPGDNFMHCDGIIERDISMDKGLAEKCDRIPAHCEEDCREIEH